ncbi:hypothetical protein K435DRAFT_466087 [Dendrothele bispora CBS 962.96]|uniref:Uncharacterized protein n=1 Tax=Dendrothele bispora (strain CBS 962.96) TaxID=1314807 RepID=A0A4S8MCB6_DENBC|nr:hypothetical protein K435DRAFT_466087 [Dendrothele bispora CBS 962.96]
MLTLHLVGPSRQSSQTQIPTQTSQAHDTSPSLEKQDPIEFLANLKRLALSSPPALKNSSRSTPSRIDIAKRVSLLVQPERTITQVRVVGQNCRFLSLRPRTYVCYHQVRRPPLR